MCAVQGKCRKRVQEAEEREHKAEERIKKRLKEIKQQIRIKKEKNQLRFADHEENFTRLKRREVATKES